MVIRLHASAVGPSISQLTADFRRLMSPDTASRLRERRANKLEDYIAMSGPLGVTHLFLFSRSKNGNVHLRICLAPRGPTLTFRVEGYSLSKDVEKGVKRPKGGDLGIWKNAPLVVMNNFSTAQQAKGKNPESEAQQEQSQDPIHKQLETLMTTVFQGIFPAITPSSTRLDSINRILLLNRETTTKRKSKSSAASEQASEAPGLFNLSLRHYAITTRESGISKRVRRFDPSEQRKRAKKSSSSNGALPNLSRLQDAADYLLDPSAAGYTSASDTEVDSENEVEVLEAETQKVLSRKQRQRLQEQRQQRQQATAEDEDAPENDDESTTAKPKPQPRQQQKSHLQKRAIALTELGPRMKLRLVKVEEGLCEGRVMWNEFVDKSQAETAELDGRWKERRAAKEERRRVQRENVARKRGEKEKKGDEEQQDEEDGDYGSDFEVEDFKDMDEEDGGVGVEGEEWEDEDDGEGDGDEADEMED